MDQAVGIQEHNLRGTLAGQARLFPGRGPDHNNLDGKTDFAHTIQVARADGSAEVQLLNPNGLQLLTASHIHRAPDKRFGEPEELLKER